jgi:hypothetical protein
MRENMPWQAWQCRAKKVPALNQRTKGPLLPARRGSELW